MTEENASPVPTTTDQEISPSTHRVKLYQLDIETNWVDKGTGFCTYQLGMDRKPDQIIVHSEEDDGILLISNVLKRRLYQRQQDTLIVWTEDDNRDLALSFQDVEGCEEIWKCIGKKQDSGGSMIAGDQSDYTNQARNSPEVITLPDPELNNLIEIADTLNAARTMNEKDKISAFISNEHYIDKLMPLFETCEDLEDIVDLNLLYTVMMAILTLNHQGLIELLVRDEYVFNFMGMLEYNPKTPGMKAKHREFLKTRENVKQVVRLTDENITRKIDQAFRLEYLQAVLLNTESDEGLMGVMNNLIFHIHTDIISYFQSNHVLLTELFDQIKSQNTTIESRQGIIRFIHQLCQLSKQMPNSARVNLFRSLASYGLFDLMCFSLENSDRTIRINSLNILASFTNLDVAAVRNHIMVQSRDQKESKPLLEIIVEQFASDIDHDLKVQYFEILRLLLDPTSNIPPGQGINDPANKIHPDTDEFLQVFYDKHVSTLLHPIESLDLKPISLKGPIEPLILTQDQAQLCLYLCEFLCFAVRNHGYRSKYILLSSNLFSKIAQLYRSKYAYIKLGALRFFRVCVSKTDEFFNQNLLKHNIIEPTIRVLLDTNGRDCLLNSACLDFFDYIRKENIKSLVNRSISQFGAVLDTITYISTFSQLRIKFEQNMNGEESISSATEDIPSEKLDEKVSHDGWTSSTVDDDEEEYFNGSDEEDTTTLQIPTSIAPLVNYDDDDDDEEEEEQDIPATQKTSMEQDPSLKRKKNDEEGSEKQLLKPSKTAEASDTTQQEEESSRLVKKRKSTENDTQEQPIKDDLEAIPPPPFKSRKTTDDEDEEDDVLAKKSPRQSPLSKKIVIKTSSNIKKMRSTLH